MIWYDQHTHIYIYKYVLYTIWDPVYVKVAGGFINICDFSSVKWHDDPNSLQPVMVCHGLLGCSSCRIHYEPWFAMIKRWWLYTHIYIDIRIYIYIHIYIHITLHIYIYITLEYSNPLTNREYEEFRLWDSFNMAHMHRLCPSCSYMSAKSWRGMPLPEFI